MVSSSYKPLKVSDFQSDCVNFNGMSSSGSAIENQTIASDITMTDVHLLTGGNLLVKGGKFGDKIKLQVVHPTAGVVGQYVTDYGVQSDNEFQFALELTYPAKIETGLKLRLTYVSTAEVGTRQFCINYSLHKIIIA
jgi:hypothetical protein